MINPGDDVVLNNTYFRSFFFSTLEVLYRTIRRGEGRHIESILWVLTPKIDTTTSLFLKFDTRHGRHGIFFISTCNRGHDQHDRKMVIIMTFNMDRVSPKIKRDNS